MPSVTLNLPLHVVAKPPRKDGTQNVLFIVRHDRPQGWPSTIPLPRTGARTGNLNDSEEVRRIVEDAERLIGELEIARQGKASATPGTLQAVVEAWTGAPAEDREADVVPDGASEDWKELRVRSRAFYIGSLRPIEAWSEANKHPQIASIALPAILKFLDRYNDRPAQKAALRRTLSVVFSQAMRQGARADHPFGVALRLRRAKKGRARAVTLWSRETVDAYVKRAEADGWLGGAILLWLMWETSADASDCIVWNKRDHFIDDPASPAILYARGKTALGNEPVPTPISKALADMIRRNGAFFLVTDPDGKPYAAESIKADNQRGYHFRRLKEAVVAAGGPPMILDHLRHSALTHAVAKGASLTDTKTLSRHANTATLDRHYLQLTASQVANVQRARGIIE